MYIEKINPNENNDIAAFQTEVSALKEKEKEEGKTAHFFDLDPAFLDATDMAIWRKFKEKTLTKEEFSEYRKNISGPHNNDFMAYIANKIGSWSEWPSQNE
ncbi:MAG: hypothetical protein BMS9Abin13_260 [Patescibacteria group bacterium]|nr:MAG: hypothetical protein BMS9Abin13_260 [Patescibacteria group bacterium]